MSEKLWIEKGKTYREEFRNKTRVQRVKFWIQEQTIRLALRRIKSRSEIRRILDAGCGFGRITRILCEMFPFERIYGLDISEDQLWRAHLKMERVQFIKTSIVEPVGGVPFNDLTTAVELLMHISPDQIESAIINICDSSREFVLTVDWWTMDQVDIWAAKEEGFCYLHNYGRLFSEAGFYRLTEKKIPFVNQKIGIWRRTDE